MKTVLDLRFILTALITFFSLILIVVIVHAIAGLPAASVAGSVLGALAWKFFDQLDYVPTVELGTASRSVLPLVYSAVASVCILSGALVFLNMAVAVFKLAYGDSICHVSRFVVTIALDWGGVVLGGWLIGRMFSDHALGYCALAGIVYVVADSLNIAAGIHVPRVDQVFACFSSNLSETTMEEFRRGGVVGYYVGSISRAYVAICMARVSSRHENNKTVETYEHTQGRA
jgi:hypothetical protein